MSIVKLDRHTRRILDYRRQPRFAFLERRFGPLAIGDIAHDRQEVIALEADVGAIHFDRKYRAVFSFVEALEDDIALPHDTLAGDGPGLRGDNWIDIPDFQLQVFLARV